MYQDLHSCSAHWVEGAEDVQGIGGAEPEDGFTLIQHDEGLWTEGTVVRSGAGHHLGALKPWLQGEKGMKEEGLPFTVDTHTWVMSEEREGGVWVMSGGFRFSSVLELPSQQGTFQPSMVAHAYNASPWEVEARRLPRSVPAASTADACKAQGDLLPPPLPPCTEL